MDESGSSFNPCEGDFYWLVERYTKYLVNGADSVWNHNWASLLGKGLDLISYKLPHP